VFWVNIEKADILQVTKTAVKGMEYASLFRIRDRLTSREVQMEARKEGMFY